MRLETFYFASTVANYPDFPYQKIKDAILGKAYFLSFTFVGTKRARTLNQTYRQKNYIPDVLSFPLTATTGEIYLCPKIAYREAKDFNLSKDGFIAFLFIHGCLHLKGHDHGATMETLEQRYIKRFQVV